MTTSTEMAYFTNLTSGISSQLLGNSYNSTIASTGTYYSQVVPGSWKPIESKEDKSKKLLQQVDDRERLCDLLKLVKQGKIKIEEAVDKIQEDEQFNRVEEAKWYDSSITSTNPYVGGVTTNIIYGTSQGTSSNTSNISG